MEDFIHYFMFGYQKFFRVNQRLAAERIFKLLDERFKPEVFLVGIRRLAQAANHPACVEPEDDFWIESPHFFNVLDLAENLRTDYPESHDLISHPLADQRWQEALFLRSVRDSILETLRTHESIDPRKEYFASIPVHIGAYLVSIVLGLQCEYLISHYRLSKDTIGAADERTSHVTRSLLDATVAEFFAGAREELQKPDPGLHSEVEREAEELVRTAARRLTTDCAMRADEHAIEGWHNLFHACTAISAMYYEKSPAKGRMILAKKNHEALCVSISFAEERALEQYRGARKLLELTSHNVALHTNSHRFFGLVTVGSYEKASEDLFEIHFLGHHHWELQHAGKVLMQVLYGQPSLPREPTYKAKLTLDLPRIFPGISTEDVRTLISLVETAESEQHGTLLVITAEAESEAVRLGAQSIQITPQLLTPELLSVLTPIDGAVLIEPTCHCHAIGVILDGIASPGGDTSRGARYNSGIRYVNSLSKQKIPCLAVVVSEDRGIDLVPDFPKAIRRSEIEQIISCLEELAQREKTPWPRYNNYLDWLTSHRFYLREEHCKRINQAVTIVEGRATKENPTRIRITRNAFTANQGLDEKFFYITDDDPG